MVKDPDIYIMEDGLTLREYRIKVEEFREYKRRLKTLPARVRKLEEEIEDLKKIIEVTK